MEFIKFANELVESIKNNKIITIDMKEPIDEDLEFSDENLYANFDAFKTLLDAGITRGEALKRTGLTEQIAKDLELEEEEMSFRSEFEEKYDKFEGEDDEFGTDKWSSDDDEFGSEDDEWGSKEDSDDYNDDEGSFGSGGYDEY